MKYENFDKVQVAVKRIAQLDNLINELTSLDLHIHVMASGSVILSINPGHGDSEPYSLTGAFIRHLTGYYQNEREDLLNKLETL